MDSRTLNASNIRRTKLDKGGNAKDSISPPSHQIDPSQTKSINTIKYPRQESRTDYVENPKEFLDLSNKRLSLSDISHRYVTKLDLSSCGLTTLPERLEYCDELEELNLSNNHLRKLRTPFWRYIPWGTLRKLNLSGCGLRKLPEGLKFCDELEELNLSNNPLSHLRARFWGSRWQYSAIFHPVPQARIFQRICSEKLKGLHFAQYWPVCVRCPLTIRAGTSGRHFAKFHQRAYIPWGTLRKLDLSGCRLTKLPEGLKFCDELEELNLSNNPLDLSGKCLLKYIPRSSLKKLDLSGCDLTELPNDLEEWGNLQELNFSNNSFDHQDLLEKLNSGKVFSYSSFHKSGKELLKPKASGLGLSKLTRIIFEDAVYTQSGEVWTVVHTAPKSQGEKNKDDVLPPESQREKKEDEIDEKDSIIDVPEYSFSIVDASEKTSDNSITISEEGGCFHVPVASAFLLFPPNAVEEKVTLKCSRVKYKDCEVKPRDGEVFVSRILKVEPEGLTFKKPVTVLLSHSLYEDQDFLYFYELIVENLSPTGWQELKTEQISSIKDVPKEMSNKEILDDYLPFAKATIHETCTLIAATRIRSDQISIPANRSHAFVKPYGDNAELNITFPLGGTKETLNLTVQLFPPDAVLKEEMRLDKNLVCAPVIRVSGQTTPFLKAVDVELTYSHSDVVNIEKEFLPVGKRVKFTTEYGLLLRSHKETESKSDWQALNESNDVYIVRSREDQLKFSFSVEHFSDFLAITYTRMNATVDMGSSPWTSITVNYNDPIAYSGVVSAVHKIDSIPKTLRAVLAPKHCVKDDLKVKKIVFMDRLRPGEPIYFCVPMSDSSHLPIKDHTLWFNPDEVSQIQSNTDDDTDLNGKYMHFLKDNECNNCGNHDISTREDGRAKVPIHISEAEPVQENIESGIAPMQENGASSFQGDVNDGHIPSKDKTMRNREDCCERFEKKIVDEFLDQLNINKGNLTDPNIGPIPKKLNDAGAAASIVLGVAGGTTLALSIGTLGIGAFVGAAVAGITFTVTKFDKRKKKANAKKLNEKMEIYFHSELKCIIMDVARELSRMFEYQVVELMQPDDETQINLLAKCAVNLMLSKWEKTEKLDRNTLLKKVLQDGKVEKTELLTKEGDKWFAPDVFRQPGLRKMIFGKDDAKFEYFVRKASEKEKNACDTSKYGYRGQFLELKSDKTKKLPSSRLSEGHSFWPVARGSICGCSSGIVSDDKDETYEVKDCHYCNKSFIESSHNENSQHENSQHENCTIYHQYFCESVIDSHYTERREPNRTYNPIHVLIRCPNVLESFNQIRDEKPSLANFMKKTLLLPEHHLVLPIYRPHLPKKITNLEKSDLTGSDFSHSDFTNSSLEECTFTKVVMLFAELAGTRMSNSTFNKTLISHSNLVGVTARKCKWVNMSLLYSRVEDADLDDAKASISGSTLVGTNTDDARV